MQLEWAGNPRGGGLATARLPDVLLVVLAAAGFLAGIGAVWEASYGPIRPLLLPGDPIELLVGWSFIGSGLASWRAGSAPRLRDRRGHRADWLARRRPCQLRESPAY